MLDGIQILWGKVEKDKGGLGLQFQVGWSEEASLRRWLDEKDMYVLCQTRKELI